MRYQNFRLLIQTDNADGFFVKALTPMGEGGGRFVPPVGDDGLALGEQLFDSIFQGPILRLYEGSLGLLERDPGVGLRIELLLDPQAPALAALQALPWELLRQPGKPEFLALDPRRPIVRYLEAMQPVVAISRSGLLRILAVAAQPGSLAPLAVDQELENLRQAVWNHPAIEVVTPKAPTLAALRQALVEMECHVLHFMGHGSVAGGRSEPVLYFETEDGFEDPVRGTDLLNKLVGRPALQLAVLNACESASVPEESFDGPNFNPFAGVASTLVLGGVPAVVAMQRPLSDRAAIAFSRAFYQRFAAGSPVEAAVAEGRQEMHSADPGGQEWMIPVLFMRTPAAEPALPPDPDLPPAAASQSSLRLGSGFQDREETLASQERRDRPLTVEASVLVSGEGLFHTLHGMSEKCHLLDLLDFCTLAEALVLNDKIEVVCDAEYAHTLSQTSSIGKLLDAGVISTITSHIGVTERAPSPLTRAEQRLSGHRSKHFSLRGNELKHREPLGTFTLEQVMDEATSLLRAERELGISVLPMRRFASLYVPNAKVREEHTVCDLMSRYDELSSNLRQSREKLRFSMSPLVVAQIPPIPVTVLERARTGSEILDRILEVRDDYRGLREALTALRIDLSNEEISPKEKRRTVESWLRAWATLARYDTGSRIAIGNTVAEIIDVDKSIDSETIDFKPFKLLEMIARSARSTYHRWRVRMLHNTAERYLEIADGQVTRDLKRIYKKSFGDQDLQELRDWEEMISIMTIDLEGMSPKQRYNIERSGFD